MAKKPKTAAERKRNAPYKPKGKVSEAAKARRRELVSALWVKGYSTSEITRIVEAQHNEKWHRKTIGADVTLLRERWAKEAGDPAQKKAELEAMAREVYKQALSVQKPIVYRTRNKGTKGLNIRTEMEDAPDLATASKCIERIASLHGLNVTTHEGSLAVSGLAEMMGMLDNPDPLE